MVEDGKTRLAMEERFAADQGLHWLAPNAVVLRGGAGAVQAEDAALSGGAVVTRRGKKFRGEGFVDLSGKGATLTWYQENDGDPRSYTLAFRYTQEDPKGQRTADLVVNGKRVETLTFANTGSWNRDWKSLTVEVQLKAARTTSRWSPGAGGGPRVDELSVK